MEDNYDYENEQINPKTRLESPPPLYKLYSLSAVILATVFGAPIAGGIIIGLNYQRLANPEGQQKAILFSALGIVALLLLGFIVPENFPSSLFHGIQILIMWQAAKNLQGAAIEQHKQAGGQFESPGKAVGIGILCLRPKKATSFGGSHS